MVISRFIGVPVRFWFMLLLIVPCGWARTIMVDAGGEGEFTSIQAAIDAAEGGDEIVVAPGTYYEGINFNGKAVKLVSSGGADVTIIDGSKPAVLLQEDFDSGSYIGNHDGWSIIDQGTISAPSDWVVQGSQLVQKSNIHSSDSSFLGTFAVWDDPAAMAWTDYAMTLTMRSTDDDGMGVMFRYQDPQNYYRFIWFREKHFNAPRRQLSRVQNGEVTVLAHNDVAYVTNQSYEVKIVTSGTNLQVLVDGYSVLTASDSTFADGSVALYCWGNQNTIFDNIEVAAPIYHVVQCITGEGSGTILEGFTITGGNANGPGRACEGGGMRNYYSSPRVLNCTFSGNTAEYGGGMHNFFSTTTVTNCTFSGNIANVSGGGIYNSSRMANITNCTFSRNWAVEGGGMSNLWCSTLVTGCTFSENSAGWLGGGMFNHYSGPRLSNCIFSDNSAHEGGGKYNSNSNAVLTNCVFLSNTASTSGGAISNRSTSKPTVTNCTFIFNAADIGGGMSIYENSNPVVTNCIVWNNTRQAIYDPDSKATVTYSNIHNYDWSAVWPGTGNINIHPMFVDAAGGDFRLRPYSPCIDAGSNTAPSRPAKDMASNPRVIDGNGNGNAVVDMGVYEFDGEPPAAGTGALSVTIEPAEAVDAGAMWRIKGQSQWRTSGAVVKMAPGYYTVEFTDLAAWFEPRNVEVCYGEDDARTAVRSFRVRVIGDVSASVSGKYRPLPVYEIGRIPPVQAPHGSVLEFFADAGAAGDGAAFSVSPSFDPRYPAPLGAIAIDAQSGRFTYEPNVNDRAAFDVTFWASTGGDPVEQTIRITPVADPVEEYNIVSRPVQAFPDPLSRDYIFVNEMKSDGNEWLNGSHKSVRSVTVAAIELTVDDTPNNLVYGYDGHTDIKDLTIYAETLIIRKSLWLPQTEVTIYARQILFEDNGGTVQISTTPRPSGTPADGLDAGNVHLFIEAYVAQGGLGRRFVMNNAPGSGGGAYGQGGVLTCSFDASSPLSWLNPYALKMVVAHARDAYLYGYMPETLDILEQYDELLGVASRLEGQNLPASRRFELEQMRQEITTLIHRLDNNLDYFGNPSDWVPALSFEVLKATYEQEIRRAIRVLYLSYWLNNQADQITNKAAWLANCRDRLWDETEQSRLELTNYLKLIGPLEKRAGEIVARVGRADGGECFGLLCDLKKKEAELLARAEKAHGWKKAIESLVTISTSTLTGASRSGQAGAALGAASGLMTVGQDMFLSMDPWQAAGEAADVAQRFSSINFKEATDAWQGQFQTVNLAGLEANGADAYLQNLQASARSMADGMWQVKETLGTTRIDDEAADAELKRIKASNPEFRRLVDVVVALTIEKEVFGQQLAAAMQKVSTLSNAMTNNVLAIDAMNRDASEINRIFDDRVLMYAKDMERRAVARLKKYHYYMAKAYEYRFLEPYPGNLNIESIFQAMANLVSYNVTLQSGDFDSLAALYEAQLSELANDIMEDFLAGHVEKNVGALYKLSAEEISRLNAGEPLTLNLFARGLFPSDVENIRIVAIKVHDIDVDVAGNCGGWGYIKLKMTHPSVSKLQRGDNIYQFRHFAPGREAFEIMWESHYYPQFNPPYLSHVSTSVASQSLLGSLLREEYRPDMLIYSRPGAWADIVITKEDEKEGPCRLDIQTMWLKLEYDYYGKYSALHTLRVATEPKELTPHFLVDAGDLNSRRDGKGDFYRIYDWDLTSAINVTAPATYGHYRFDKWTNRLGEALGSQPTRQVFLEPLTGRRDQTVRAHYVYEGPVPSVVDFNEDYWVDYQDFIVLAGVWLAGPSASEWDARYDINEDGVIDTYELMLFAQDWLKAP